MSLDELRYQMRIQEVTDLLNKNDIGIISTDHLGHGSLRYTCVNIGSGVLGEEWLGLSVSDRSSLACACRAKWHGMVFVLVPPLPHGPFGWDCCYVLRSHAEENMAEL